MVYLGELNLEQPDVSILIGMSEEKGQEFAKDIGFRFRCRSKTIAGVMQSFVGTADVRGNRINYEVTDGIITKAYIG
jgi:hypothetical protein